MVWEESRRKEQVFRKAKTNREVILKTVEDANGNINLKFAIKDNEISTELTLTLEEWESIITFLNRTSSTITEEISKKLGKSVKDFSIKPLTEYIKPEKAEPNIIPKAELVKVPAAEVIREVRAELVKVPAEEVITEFKAEPVKVPAAEVITEIKAEPVKVFAEKVITEVKVEPLKMPAEEVVLRPEVELAKLPINEFILEFEEPVAAEIEKKVNLSESKLVNEPITGFEIQKGQELEPPLVSKPIPVDNDVFDELTSEIQKISPIPASEGPKIDSEPIAPEIKPISMPEEVKITERPLNELFSEPQKSPLIEEETQSLSIDSLDIKKVLDLLNQAQEAPKAIKPEEELIELSAEKEPMMPPPTFPKIPGPSREQLEALLTPIKQPKISIIEKLDTQPSAQTEKFSLPLAPQKKSEPAEIPGPSRIQAEELLEESRRLLDIPPAPLPSAPMPSPPAPAKAANQAAPPIIEIPAMPVSLGKEDEQLTSEQKEARIISAMEEVAALMPPGPAKKFVEEMMLKRAEKSDMDKPRIPKLNNSESSESEEKQSKSKFW